MNTDDTVLYDVLWQYFDYIDIISMRLVDKKCYKLSVRKDLWRDLFKRDFTFLTYSDFEFSMKDTHLKKKKGYDLIRMYIFGFVLEIQTALSIVTVGTANYVHHNKKKKYDSKTPHKPLIKFDWYKPTTAQQKVYNSLIEWREECVSGPISEEIRELIMLDIYDALNCPRGNNNMILAHYFANFDRDIQNWRGGCVTLY
jgi:hypothetical protein